MFNATTRYKPLGRADERDESHEMSDNIKFTKQSASAPLNPTDSLSNLEVDRAEGTRKICLIGLALSILAGIGALIIGIISKGSQRTWRVSPAVKEFSILPVNVLLLLITECLGYIHSTSLRWALFSEGRLEFNSNQRLLTFSRKYGPNNAFFSIIFFICLTLTYAAGNMLLVFNTSSFYDGLLDGGSGIQDGSQQEWIYARELVSLTKVIPIVLGIIILTMCALDLWCIQRTKMPSWSSDPFTTVAAGLNAGLVHRRGRAMMSVRDRHLPDQADTAMTEQPSPRAISKLVTGVMLLIIAALIALIIWSAVITYVAYDNPSYQGQNGSSWSFIPTATGAFAYVNGLMGSSLQNPGSATLTVFLFFFAANGEGDLVAVSEGRMVGVLLLYVAIQTVVTIALHCAELQVQLSRDEHVWRKLQSRNGKQPPKLYNSILQPVETWQGSGLLVFKVFIHWLFGAAIQVDYGQGMLMRPPQIIYMTVAWIAFVAFMTTVTFSRPKGVLPATYGHLQTMVDVADMWSQKMYWGDKDFFDEAEDIRHCGTSDRPLPPILVGYRYA